MQTQCNGNASISNSISSSKSISKSKLNKIEDRIHDFKKSVLTHKDFSDKDKK